MIYRNPYYPGCVFELFVGEAFPEDIDLVAHGKVGAVSIDGHETDITEETRGRVHVTLMEKEEVPDVDGSPWQSSAEHNDGHMSTGLERGAVVIRDPAVGEAVADDTAQDVQKAEEGLKELKEK